MDEYIKRLERFIDEESLKKRINALIYNDSFMQQQWHEAQSLKEWQAIKSDADVRKLIKFFENAVNFSPNGKDRNEHLAYMLIAQYKAFRGIRKWLQCGGKTSMLYSSSFPILTEDIVEEIIAKMTALIEQI